MAYPYVQIVDQVKVIIETVRPVIDAVSTVDWDAQAAISPLIRCAMLRRQFDCLVEITQLVERQRGYAAVHMLRPAHEERLWVTYLNSISEALAEDLLLAKLVRERHNSLMAQWDYLGPESMDDLGLTRHLSSGLADYSWTEIRLREIGKQLGWPKRKPGRAQLPTTAFVAAKVGLKKEYDFVYHATSRFVHFSAAELLRRVWGDGGRFTIDSMHFADFWGAFAAYWGARIFVCTCVDNESVISCRTTGHDYEPCIDAAKRMSEIGIVPIITPEELAWTTDK